MTLYRVTESFPFDSSKPTKFDDYGRPILDRAVSSRTMRDSFAKIFSNGVFGKPADAFIISKGDGLNVRINPGMCVIDGAMGGWREEQSFALPAATGKVAYGIFLRLDDNSDMRSIYVRIDAGAAGTSPVPPEPESGDKVTELRLGYVVVPSGATDLSEATITNEKGLEVCPYTAPFAEIDLAEIIHDAQTYADERNEEFTAYLVENMEFIASCLDGTVAGNLQAQIDELREGAFSADNVDARNLEIEADTPTGTKLLRISDNFVDGTLAKIDAETRKLMLQVQAIRAAMGLGNSMGVLQPEYGGTGASSQDDAMLSVGMKPFFVVSKSTSDKKTIPGTDLVFVATTIDESYNQCIGVTGFVGGGRLVIVGMIPMATATDGSFGRMALAAKITGTITDEFGCIGQYGTNQDDEYPENTSKYAQYSISEDSRRAIMGFTTNKIEFRIAAGYSSNNLYSGEFLPVFGIFKLG
ncbi:MAG: hypothetical protein IJW29_02230 [Clostridia bacterium]|nr:hypothetical protein [Clostridia bacterium]